MLAHIGAKITQLVGVPKDSSWSQIQVSTPTDPDEISKGGALVSLICIPSSPRAAEEGNEKLQQLIENFQSHTGENRLEWLKNTLGEFEAKNQQNERLLMLLVVPLEDKRALYVAGCGPLKVLLERNGKLMPIWTQKQTGQVVSGWVSTGDKVVAGSTEFVDEVWLETGGSLESRVEEVQAAIGGHEKQALMVGSVLDFGEPGVLQEKKIEEMAAPVRLAGTEMVEEEVPQSNGQISIKQQSSLSERLMGGKALSWLTGSDNYRPSRKASLIIGGVFLLLLLGSVALGAVRKEKLRIENEYQTFIEPLEHSLDEAVSLKTVNPVRSRSLVSEVRDQAAAAGSRFDNDKFGSRWKAFNDHLAQVWTEVSGESAGAGQLWLDLTVIRDSLSGYDLFWVDEGKLGILDRSGKVAVQIETINKNAKVVGGSQNLTGVRDASGWNEEIIVLKDDGVGRFASPDPTSASLLDQDGEIWDQTRLVSGFGGNLYLAGGRDIWRYPALEGALGRRQRWLKPQVEPDLSSAVDWEIDGEIWILLENGAIKRFSQGQEAVFELKGLVNPWVDPIRLAIDTNKKELVILDRELKSLIFISQENGEYKRQLVWEKLGEATDLIVDSEKNRVFMVTGTEIYELAL